MKLKKEKNSSCCPLSKKSISALVTYLLCLAIFIPWAIVAYSELSYDLELEAFAFDTELRLREATTLRQNLDQVTSPEQVVDSYSNTVDNYVRNVVIPNGLSKDAMKNLTLLVGLYPASNFLNMDTSALTPQLLGQQFETIAIGLLRDLVVPQISDPNVTFRELYLEKTNLDNDLALLQSIYLYALTVSTRNFRESRKLSEFISVLSIESPQTIEGFQEREMQSAVFCGQGLQSSYANVAALELCALPYGIYIEASVKKDFDVLQKVAIPMQIILLSVTLWCTTVCLFNYNALEIRSRYTPFLIYLFASLICCAFFLLLHISALIDGFSGNQIRSVLFTLAFASGMFGFSAINCRQYMLYQIFNSNNVVPISKRGGKKKDVQLNSFVFFVPLLWHVPLVALSSTLFYFVASTGTTKSFDSVWVASVITLVLTSVFLFENLFWILKTQKLKNLFIDFYFNIRILVVFSATLFSVEIYSATLYAHQLWTVIFGMTFTLTFSFTCYLLDSFLLISIRLLITNRLDENNSARRWMQSIDLMGQKPTLSHISDIMNDRQFRKMFLDYSIKNHSDENVRFLIDWYSLEGSNSLAEKKHRFQLLYQNYFAATAKYQINVSYKSRERVQNYYESGAVLSRSDGTLPNIEPDTENTADNWKPQKPISRYSLKVESLPGNINDDEGDNVVVISQYLHVDNETEKKSSDTLASLNMPSFLQRSSVKKKDKESEKLSDLVNLLYILFMDSVVEIQEMIQLNFFNQFMQQKEVQEQLNNRYILSDNLLMIGLLPKDFHTISENLTSVNDGISCKSVEFRNSNPEPIASSSIIERNEINAHRRASIV